MRLLDVAVIAVSAFLALQMEQAAAQPGYDNALVAFALLASAFLFPLFGLYRSACSHIVWRCVCAPVAAWILALAIASLVTIIRLDPYRPAGEWYTRWMYLGARKFRFSANGSSKQKRGTRDYEKSRARSI